MRIRNGLGFLPVGVASGGVNTSVSRALVLVSHRVWPSGELCWKLT